jgi:hypothetical protein
VRRASVKIRGQRGGPQFSWQDTTETLHGLPDNHHRRGGGGFSLIPQRRELVMDVEMEVQFPVFLTARFGRSAEVRSFSSVEAMESYLEPIDVEDDEYLAWDAEGVALRFKVDTSAGGRRWLRLIPTGVRDLEGLCEAISQHALKLGLMIDANGECPPTDLLQQVRIVEEEHRKLQRPWWQFWR